MSPTIGVIFRPQSPLEDLRAAAAAADQAGIHELWLWEDCFLAGGLTTATAALAWSQHVNVGIGLLPVPLRNPAVAAMEIATLAALWPGRFVPGLGHGVAPWMRQVGAGVESPMTLLREYTLAVRELLAGGTVDVQGRYVRLEGVALDRPPAEPPELVLGGRGPKTVALAGEVADGLILDDVTDQDVVSRARTVLDEARSGAGRDGRGRIIAFAPVDPREDPAGLDDRVADLVARLSDGGADTVVVQPPEDAPDPRPLLEAVAPLL